MPIQVKNISVEFPGIRALKGIDLEFQDGRMHAVLGANGSGKSTLVKVMTGIYKPQLGAEIIINGKKFPEIKDPNMAKKLGIRVVHQEAPLINSLTIAESIAVLHGYPKTRFGRILWKDLQRYSGELLKFWDIDLDSNMLVRQISSSERSMVAMATAIGKDEELSETKALILDEADASIPEEEARRFLAKARKVADLGIPVIMVTHRLKSVMETCDDVSILNDGNVVFTGPLSHIGPDFIVSKMLKSEHSIVVDDTIGVDNLWRAVGAAPPVEGSGTVLSVKDLKSSRLHGISFSVERGEVLGIAGITDSGVTELPHILGGSGKWESGQIVLDGECLKPNITPKQAIRKGISLVPSDRFRQGGVMTRTLRENMLLPNEEKFFLKPKKAYQAVDVAMQVLDVRPAYADQQFGKFSGGNQQKAIVAKWLFTCPKVLVLDDPTYGVDPAARMKIFAAIQDSARNHVGIVVFSTEPEQLATLCNRVIVLKKGVITHELKREDGTLTRESIARWCYA